MAEDLSNSSMEGLLTEFTELVKNAVMMDFPQRDKLEKMTTILEEVTSELKTYCSSWKTATREAEDRAKQLAERNDELEETNQLAERNEELEKTRKQMAERNKEFEETKIRMAEKNEELEERRKQIDKQEEQLSRRALELEAKEKLFEESRAALEKKEELLQQQSVDLEQTERNSKDEQARLQEEATIIGSEKSRIEQQWKDSASRSKGLQRREDNLKVTHQSVSALNEEVNKSLAAVRQEYEENEKLREFIQERHHKLTKIKSSLLQRLNSWSTQFNKIQTSRQELVNFEANHRGILADMRQEITSLSTDLEKQAEEARDISKDIEVADNKFGRLLTSTERQIGNVTEASTRLEGVSTKIDNVTEASTGLEGASTKIGNVTEVSSGLDELSAKFQQFQPTMTETLRELTEAVSKAQAAASKAQADASKAQADAAKAQADCQRSLVHHSVSRYEESRAKRGLGPTSPEKPATKRRRQARQSSVGSVGMLTNFGPPEPLPENILDNVRSPRGQGRVTRIENPRRQNDSSPLGQRPSGTSGTASTPSGRHGLLGSSSGSQNALHSQPSSSTDPATATGQPTMFNPESSSPGTLIASSQSGVSATDPPGLSESSEEVKHVWRQIDFPANWDLETSKTLLKGFKKAANKKNQPRSRPAGLLDSASAQPNCLRRRVSKEASGLDNGNGKRCSDCTGKMMQCVHVSFVAEGLADVEYDQDGQEKRWKLTIRED